MGAEHASVYSGFDDVEVVGVFSRDRKRAQAVAESCGSQAYDDAAVLVGRSDLDAIDVCVPSAAHRPHVIAALGRGHHVFCETPLALSLTDAHRMRDAARGAGRLLQVGLLMRGSAHYQHLKRVAESGEHGRLVSLTTYRLGSYLRPGAPDHKAHYSDPITELMTFDFDVVGWLMGPPARLAATAAEVFGGPGDVTAVLGFADSRHATVLASGTAPIGASFRVGLRALFERASIELDTQFDAMPPTSRFTLTTDDGPATEIPIAGANPYETELRRFVDCVRGRADPTLFDCDRAIEALVLSQATRRALDQRRTIALA
jgi:predicted dehydrogenase